MKVKGKKINKVAHIVTLIGVLTVNIVPSINKAYIIATDIRDEEGIVKGNIEEYQEVKRDEKEELEVKKGTTEEGGISVKSFNIKNIGSYTPRTKEITGHATSEYDDGEFRGTLERYVASGSPAGTKEVTNEPSSEYNKDGYTGTLTQYLHSGFPSDTKRVEMETSANYNKDGYVGTLERYVTSGSPADTKYVTNQSSSSYNSGGYTGTLTQYVHSGSASQSKEVSNQSSANYSDSSGYTGTLTRYLYSGSYTPSDTKYVTGQTSSNYNSGGYTGTLTRYLAGGSSSSSKYVTNQTSSYYNSGGYSGSLSSYTQTISSADSKYVTYTWVTTDTRYYSKSGGVWTRDRIVSGTRAPTTYRYNSGGYSGTLSRTDPTGYVVRDDGAPTSSTPGTSFVSVRQWHAYYGGTVTKPAVTATRYQGYVYTADTRYYRYRGDVTRPASDTRVYRYRGTVSTPDTRVYRYQGDVSKPDTRIYHYRGDVTRPDTREYRYQGTVSKPDTREYAYQGTVYEIDKDAPEITFETDGYIEPNTTQGTVVNVRDIYTGVELSQYQWSTSPEFPEDGDWVQFNDGDTITKTENGKLETYYLHITATDKEGNVAISTSKAFAIGRSKPETPQYKLSTEQYTNGNVVVEVFGVMEDEVVYYKEGESEWVEYDKPIEITKNTTLTIKSIGLTGEESEEVVIVINNIDKTPPTVVTENLNSEWTTGDVTFDIIATDEDSGVDVNITVKGEQGEMVEDSTGRYKYTYTATYNGEYVFIVKDKSGNETEHSVNVTTIDRDNPEIEVTGNPTEYVEDDEITLTIKASDYGSGVKGITLPDGTVVNQDETNYVVRENGVYKFTVEDNVGNKEEFTITVDKLMIEYFFYIHDSKGQPLQGAEFVLIRDGEDYATATSDESGLVHFGKVPPTGKYTIRQIKAPDGHNADPEEKDVDVDDESDPIEIINYPRGEELPATGTIDSIIHVGSVITLGMMATSVGNKKKRYRNTL